MGMVLDPQGADWLRGCWQWRRMVVRGGEIRIEESRELNVNKDALGGKATKHL